MENEIEQLKAEIAAKDAIIQEMKTAADAQHAEAERLGNLAEEAAAAGKQAAEALEAANAEIEQMKTDFAAQIAGTEADLADWKRRYEEMRGEYEARNAARDTQAANLRAELEAANAAEVAELKAFIAELEARNAQLEAAAKTAEQLAAEIAARKYGAALPAEAAPATVDIDTLRASYEAVKSNPVERVKFIRSLAEPQFNALFK